MKIELRIPTMEDKDGLKAVCNAVDRKYLSDRLPINMVSENDGRTGVWRLIFVDGKLAGNISVEQGQGVYNKDSEIGYFLLTDYWSKGIMTQAVKEICRIAFEKLDIIRITGVYYEPNAASGRVLEKAGFEYEGTRKKGVAKGDRIYDLCMTGLLKETV